MKRPQRKLNNNEHLIDQLKKYYVDSAGSAEIERLGAKIDAMRNGRKNQIILVTSSIKGEGKSTVASLLARSMAIHRKKTLLLWKQRLKLKKTV